MKARKRERGPLLGVRGAGGNFGIVTEFKFASTRSARRSWRADLWPMEKSPEVLRFYGIGSPWRGRADDNCCTRMAPPLPIIPAICTGSRCRGHLMLLGDPEEGEKVVRR